MDGIKVSRFIADSVSDAVAQIRAQLGPDAIVINVRQLPAEGLARLWQKPRIEVLAYRPAEATSLPPPETSAADKVSPGSPIQEQPAPRLEPPMSQIENRASSPPVTPETPSSAPFTSGWRSEVVLKNAGLTPVNIQKIIDRMFMLCGKQVPANLTEEIQLLKKVLREFWPPPPQDPPGRPVAHLMMGPPGSGKTTCLCKWLAKSVLLHQQRVEVWRLDGSTANLAENLTVYCDMLGVNLERAQPARGPDPTADLLFIDLPGMAAPDSPDRDSMQRLLSSLPALCIHLVLNAAYETSILLAQIKAFSSYHPADLILTHLDEETRWGKLWNLVLGTKCSLRFFSAGQNIPGEFLPASADLLIYRQFPSN
ncbi:MAG TPA: hypothetical protein P5055_09695 [Candidatus Paceibacterota bacterium]|nr:hypothetical protein [Verrucomicrobiota bacterium]HSA00996.1 hypothetical protein [Candidatus Paceibacterota bacterium]